MQDSKTSFRRSVWVRNRTATLQPRGIHHVAEHTGSCGEPIGSEIARFLRSLALESARFLQLVDLFYVLCAFPEIDNVIRKDVAFERMDRCHP